MKKCIKFYKKFGFKDFKSWKADDDSIKITMLKLNNIVIEIFCYKEYTQLPKTAIFTATDLPAIVTKHFGLGVEKIQDEKNL